jgi:hypothetical protein
MTTHSLQIYRAYFLEGRDTAKRRRSSRSPAEPA